MVHMDYKDWLEGDSKLDVIGIAAKAARVNNTWLNPCVLLGVKAQA